MEYSSQNNEDVFTVLYTMLIIRIIGLPLDSFHDFVLNLLVYFTILQIFLLITELSDFDRWFYVLCVHIGVDLTQKMSQKVEIPKTEAS